MNFGLDKFGLPKTNREHLSDKREVLQEQSYNLKTLKRTVLDQEPRLTQDQKLAYDLILTTVGEKKTGFFFLDAPGGTGITFLTNLILAKVRLEGSIAIAVASSGIAATLLDGGKTAHSVCQNFTVNLVSNETPTCNIGRSSGVGHLLKLTKLIVWDECSNHR